MASFLIDYENVANQNGLDGVQYLTPGDTLYLFYSHNAGKIRTDQLEAIQSSGCDFYAYKLDKTGKNALDFYLTFQVGEIMGASVDNQIVIVSNDTGFNAVVDFFRQKYGQDGTSRLIVKPSITQGIVNLHSEADVERRKEVMRLIRKQDIDEALGRLQLNSSDKKRLRKAIHGTKYQKFFDQIYAIVQSDNIHPEMKKIYTDALHKFGKTDGLAIYNLVKTNYYKK